LTDDVQSRTKGNDEKVSENFHKANNGKGRKMLMNMVFHGKRLLML